jgi:hypothetical protein
VAAARIPTPIRSLLYRMLEPEPALRPTAADVARAAHDLVDELSGPTLEQWARHRTWPEGRPVRGRLQGSTVTESLPGDPPPPGRGAAAGWFLIALSAGLFGLAVATLAIVGVASWVWAPPAVDPLPVVAPCVCDEPPDPRDPLIAGWTAFDADPDQALRRFDLILASDPSDAAAPYARANALFHLGRANDAAVALCDALQREPKGADLADIDRPVLECPP